jgi:hypothetical protein
MTNVPLGSARRNKEMLIDLMKTYAVAAAASDLSTTRW